MTSSINSSGIIPVTQAELNANNIQGMVELVYVQTANDVLVSSMASLENALNVTNNVMNTLGGLQNLHNDLSVPGKGTFNYNYKTGSESGYVTAASAFFNSPIKPVFDFTAGTASANNFISQLVLYKNQLNSEITQLSSITPAASAADTNTLLANLKNVLKDLTTKGVASGNFTAAKNWTLDGYTSSVSTAGGQIQQNLTNAITAGQSLNSTQTQTVRQYLYIFEEYYKSASSILSKLSQLIEKMAQNIAG